LDSQKLVNKAMEVIETDRLDMLGKLQETNIKVFSLLDVSAKEIQKLNTKASSNDHEAASSLFNLTSPGEDDIKTTDVNKHSSYNDVKRTNRFETPGQLQKIDESGEDYNPYANNDTSKNG